MKLKEEKRGAKDIKTSIISTLKTSTNIGVERGEIESGGGGGGGNRRLFASGRRGRRGGGEESSEFSMF